MDCRRFAGHASSAGSAPSTSSSPRNRDPGLAEATIPPLLELLRFLGIDQNDFIDKTQSTYSLGTKFIDWAAPGQSLLASVRRPRRAHRTPAVLSLLAQGEGARPQAEARDVQPGNRRWRSANRFIFPTNSLGVAPHLRYALHVDTALTARYLRSLAERAGVIRLERKVVSATRREDGFIDELQFEDGGKLRADLYVDCSGARGQLIGEILESPVRELEAVAALRPHRARAGRARRDAPAVRAHRRARGGLAVAHAAAAEAEYRAGLFERAPERRGGARGAAWRHRCRLLAEPRRVRIQCRTSPQILGQERRGARRGVGFSRAARGRRPASAANALFNLLDHFPDKQFDPANIASYNAVIGDELERIRDFIILHYCLSRRDDSPFWQQSPAWSLPDTLAQRIEHVSRHRAHRPAARENCSPISTGSGSSKAWASRRATTIRWSTPWTSSRSNA